MNTSVRSNGFASYNHGIRVLAAATSSAAMLALLFNSIAPAAFGAVVFTETFDDLSNWAVVDADGASTANVVEAVGGNLHVFNSSNNGLGAGLYQAAANAPATGRIYFWGFQAATNGPQGAFNLSTTTGLHWFTDTPMGVYLPERTGPLIRPQIIVNNDNTGAEGLVNPNVSYDFFLEYNANPNVGLFYKLSSQTNVSDWSQIGVHLAYDDSVSPYFINMLGRGPVASSQDPDLNADWLLNQIDITDRDDDRLVAPTAVPEPSTVITGETATADTQFAASHAAINTVNNSGISGPGVSLATDGDFVHGTTTSGEMWLTAFDNPIGESLTITLPALYNIDGMRIWNYNEVDGTDGGIASYDLATSSDGVNFTDQLTGVALAQAPGAAGYVGVYSAVNWANVQFVRLTIADTHRGADDVTGIAEIMFSGTLVPEPGSMMLALCGCFGLVAARRHRVVSDIL